VSWARRRNDRIVQPIFFQLFLGSITRGVGHRVAAVTISSDLTKAGCGSLRIEVTISLSLSRTSREIHPVDDVPGDVVAFGAIDDLLQRRRSFHRRAHGEEIVFTNQDDRQFVERDQISTLRGRNLD